VRYGSPAVVPPPKPRVLSTTFCQTYVTFHWNDELNAIGETAEGELRAVRLQVRHVVGHLREVLRDARVAREDRARRWKDARWIHEHLTVLRRQREARDAVEVEVDLALLIQD
jgi:hypothetical protein